MDEVVRAEGIVRQWLWAEAAVWLRFADASSAADALRELGQPWEIRAKTPNILMAVFDTADLTALKVQLARFGASAEAIDRLSHSFDYGSTSFELVIPVTSNRVPSSSAH